MQEELLKIIFTSIPIKIVRNSSVSSQVKIIITQQEIDQLIRALEKFILSTKQDRDKKGRFTSTRKSA